MLWVHSHKLNFAMSAQPRRFAPANAGDCEDLPPPPRNGRRCNQLSTGQLILSDSSIGGLHYRFQVRMPVALASLAWQGD
jgi:hypothetical protein